MWKVSFLYPLRFELITSRFRVSSLNHLTAGSYKEKLHRKITYTTIVFSILIGWIRGQSDN